VCREDGTSLVGDALSFRLAAVDFVALGPCTRRLRDSIKRHYGNVKSPDAVDHGKRSFSVFVGGDTCVDLEVAFPGGGDQPPAQIQAAQATAIRTTRAIHKLALLSGDRRLQRRRRLQDNRVVGDWGMPATYAAFLVTDVAPLEAAKAAILFAAGGQSSRRRWKTELLRSTREESASPL